MVDLSLVSLILFTLVLARVLLWAFSLLIVQPLSDPLRKLPGPRASFFQTHLNDVTDPDLSATFHEEQRKNYGKTFRIHGFGKHDLRLMSFDLRVVSHVLSSPIYEKPWQTRSLLSSVLGRGIFTMEGAEHDFQRKIISPAFTTQSVKTLVPVFLQKAEEMRDKWDEMVSSGTIALDSVRAPSIDVSHWISRATFDAFGLACLNYNFGALQGETEEVYLAFRRMFDMLSKKTIPRILFPSLDRFFPDVVARTVAEGLNTIYKAGQNLVQEKKESIGYEKQDYNKDLLSLLIKSNLSTEESHCLSDTVLLDQITSFLFAGSDSTALSLSWCLHFLSLRPDIQSQLRDEFARPTTPVSPSSKVMAFSECESASLDGYPLLDAVVRESLRLCPPVHATIRVATKDDLIRVSEPVVLSDGTVVGAGESIAIRKGSFIHIPIEGLNFSTDIWGIDALEFKPERWMSSDPPSFPGLANVMTFSYGPHSCPGYKFTIAEMKAFLITLLPYFHFSPVEGQRIGKYNGILTRPFIKGQLKDGIQLPLEVERFEG
ncbi:cytochrome p450 [Moniliophthora roreri]|uniref:Cytochrome p450 n=1 Tax=Moniliophthora roreri TaxID=221103 RepID=A0A0W0F9X6_MONRR|nr:cytochrome p450 [Moniliophthora roreri]